MCQSSPPHFFFDDGIYFFRVHVFCIFVFSLCCSSNRDCEGFGHYHSDILINVNLFFMGRYDVLWKGMLEEVGEDLLRFVFPDADRDLDLERGIQFLDKGATRTKN